MSNPKISVIVPVYNVEKYLSECLDSILNQTLKDIEIICLNDGSTDNSLSILKEYASKDNRIILIDKENDGLGYTRKVGLDNATGKYILFCDSDDFYYELTAFEELYNYIDKVKVDVVIFESIRFDKNKGFYVEDRDLFNDPPQKEIFSYLDINNILFFRAYTWKKIYLKKFLDKYDDWFFPKHMTYEDIPFHFQIITRAKMSYINKKFYVYRMRINSIVHILNDKIICDRCLVFEEAYEAYNILKEKFDNLDFFNFMWKDFFIGDFRNYQIKSIDTVKKIGDLIKSLDTSKLFDFGNVNREAFFFFRAGLRMSPENYMEYINKKNLKIKIKEIAKLKEIRKTRDNRIKTLHEQIKNKNEQLQQKNEAITKRDETIKDKNKQIKEKNEIIKIKNEQMQHKNEQIKNRDSAIKQKNSEIQNLHIQNSIQDQVIKRLQNSWSYRIGRLFTYPLSIPLEFYKFIRDYNLLKKSDLFDSEYYLANNEDVKKAKMNPIKHYLKFGWKEGRNPSAKFDGNKYLNKRPDVRIAGLCPLVHYIKFVKDEE